MATYLYTSGGRSYATASTAYYSPLAGGAGSSGSSEPSRQVRVRDSFTWSHLYARVDANTWGGAVTVKSRVNGADGAQLVSISAGATGEFEDASNSDSLITGDLVAIVVTTPTGSGSITIDSLSSLLTHSGSVGLHVCASGGSTTIGGGGTQYDPLHGLRGGSSGELSAQVTCRTATTLSKLRCWMAANNGTTGTLTVKTRVNGADGAQSLSVGFGATGEFEDTSNSDSISAGDEVCYKITSGLNFTADIPVIQCRSSSGILASRNLGAATFTGTTAYYPIGGLSNATTPESRAQVSARSLSLRFANLCLSTPTNTRSVATTVALRRNSSSDLSLSVPASTTGLFEDTSTEVSPSSVGDEFNFAISSAAGSGSLTLGTVSVGQASVVSATISGATAGASAGANAGTVTAQVTKAVAGTTAGASAGANAGVVAAVRLVTVAGATATAGAAAGAGAVATFPAAIIVGVTAMATAAAAGGTIAAVGTKTIAGERATATAAANAGVVQITLAVSGETANASGAALLALITALSLSHPHPVIPAPGIRLDRRLPAPRVHARRSGDV